MTDSLLVTGTEDSIGKTGVALALARLAREDGASVGYMKPKGTRLESNVGKTLDADPMLARELLDLDEEMHELEPVVYSPTFVQQAIRGREIGDDVADRVREAYEGIAADRDLVVLEGGGGPATGSVVSLTDRDVAEIVDARVLVVAKYAEPWDVDETLAYAESLGDRLAGVVFNAVPDQAYDELETDVLPFLEGRDVPVHGVVPRVQELAGITVGELADELGATLLTDVPTDGYVERFSVGAMSADEALRQFRRTRDAAVITGGDRSEIHTAALEAPGVKCLILTGGHRPSGAVLGKAAEKGVPVMSVQSDTLTTVERADAVVRSGRARDERTVDRVQELVTAHVDTDAIFH
ncbi:phosphotransacetylase family protein [Halorubellus sp. JP-L1]|uniref:phosphotransacetylase family protein n=1 Tax=Halorubellus sp. JP-L1 TaxID=2715753 RepID=UPI00140D97DD|nr:phosphotransacetylase family protein [Halorubellus sp. JP-L1]NHN40423.1 phosphotransacetylase family protein [Halorubellus sp. JP-L1]